MIDLGDGLYVVPGYANAGLIRGRGGGGRGGAGSDGVATGEAACVIDARLFPESARELARLVHEACGGAPRFLVNTHFHGDHSAGSAAFLPQATVVAHDRTRQLLARYGAAHYHYLENFFGRPVSAAPTLPAVAFRHALQLHLGPRTVELRHLGCAHTAGDAVALCRDAGVVFAGDLVSDGVFPYLEDASCEGWIDALGELLRLDADRYVPGHGPVVGRDAVAKFRDALSGLRDEVAAALVAGRTIDEAQAAVAVPAFSGWALHDEWRPHAIKRVYRELKGLLRKSSPHPVPPALLRLAQGDRGEGDGDDRGEGGRNEGGRNEGGRNEGGPAE